MPVAAARIARRARRRLSDERGFTMIVAMGVLLVTSLLLAATFVALQGDAHLSRTELDSQRAYYAARAGINAYLYQLNADPTTQYWATCSHDTQSSWTSVPGATGESYEFSPVLANGASSCDDSSVVNAGASLIDANTGTVSLRFLGQSGSETRGIIASFRQASPLDYLWYTQYEAIDPIVASDVTTQSPSVSLCTYSGYPGTPVPFFRAGTRSSSCDVYWSGSDTVNGPMYTQDQFLVSSGNSPTFGRTSADSIASLAPTSVCNGTGCPGTINFKGSQNPDVTVNEPSDNTNLYLDAQAHGYAHDNVMTITLTSTGANITSCSTSSSCVTKNGFTGPIIYAHTASGCSVPTYNPFVVTSTTYNAWGCQGDVYIKSTAGQSYPYPLTVVADNNIIITGSITTSGSPGALTGNAVIGLVANNFVRIQNPEQSTGWHLCTGVGSAGTSNLRIDAAIMAMNHSFLLDNYDCGPTLGTITVTGSIVQAFRGGVFNQWPSPDNSQHGYSSKSYYYDNRLAFLSPPYLFDEMTSGWRLSRETLCAANGTYTQTAC